MSLNKSLDNKLSIIFSNNESFDSPSNQKTKTKIKMCMMAYILCRLINKIKWHFLDLMI